MLFLLFLVLTGNSWHSVDPVQALRGVGLAGFKDILVANEVENIHYH